MRMSARMRTLLLKVGPDEFAKRYVADGKLEIGPARSREAIIAAAVRNYKNSAALRGLSFDLSDDAVIGLIQSPCGYCEWIEADKLNGIDRVDSTQGYTLENSVPCCRWCNYAKRHEPVEDFRKWLNHVRRTPAKS